MSEHTRVLILGGGPAGLTAALYAARAELAPVLLEGGALPDGKFFQPGGQLMITTDVENFPGFPDGIMGPEIVEKFKAQAGRFGTDFRMGVATKVEAGSPHKVTWDDGMDERVMTCDALIIATGADAKWLGIEDEKRLVNYGVSACATCDGAFFKGVEIGVVGGGDTAMEEALFLTRYGTRVHVVHRREELRASKIMAARAQAHDKIEFHWNSEVASIEGGPDTGVTGVVLRNRVTGEHVTHPWNALFIAIGHKPNSDLFAGMLDLDEAGYIRTLPGSSATGVDGIFACGDVQDSIYRQAVTAAGTGCMAAIDAERWLEARDAAAETLTAVPGSGAGAQA
jgi:thioredoxin reductase (NADPH)